MKSKVRSIEIDAPAYQVFTYMDQIGNTGMHMTKSSMPMMGGKLELEPLSENPTGLGSKYRWHGRVMGFTMDFTVVVTQWEKDSKKVWETVGDAQMIILRWYRMYLTVIPHGATSRVELGIDYEKPKNPFFWLIALFLAPWYANWCLKNMLEDSKAALEGLKLTKNPAVKTVDYV